MKCCMALCLVLTSPKKSGDETNAYTTNDESSPLATYSRKQRAWSSIAIWPGILRINCSTCSKHLKKPTLCIRNTNWSVPIAGDTTWCHCNSPQNNIFTLMFHYVPNSFLLGVPVSSGFLRHPFKRLFPQPPSTSQCQHPQSLGWRHSVGLSSGADISVAWLKKQARASNGRRCFISLQLFWGLFQWKGFQKTNGYQVIELKHLSRKPWISSHVHFDLFLG